MISTLQMLIGAASVCDIRFIRVQLADSLVDMAWVWVVPRLAAAVTRTSRAGASFLNSIDPLVWAKVILAADQTENRDKKNRCVARRRRTPGDDPRTGTARDC